MRTRVIQFSSRKVDDLSGRLTVSHHRCVSAANRTPPPTQEAWKNSNNAETQNTGNKSQSGSMILSDHRVQIPQCTDRPNDSPFRPSFGSDAVAVVYRDRYRNHVAGSETGRIDHGTLAQMSPFSDTVFGFENADIESSYKW